MKLFHLLISIYVIEFMFLMIDPIGGRTNWFAENIPMVAIVFGLIGTRKWFKFSNFSYILMFVLIYLHTIGGHYSFAQVPFDFITNTFGFERNHFDRIAHFSVGFYAYPFAEFLQRVLKEKHKFIIYAFPLTFIISVAALYEIIEWWYAAKAGGEAGAAFLGSQGDIWDAQKDMLADTLWAIVALCAYAIFPYQEAVKAKKKKK